MNTIEDVLKSNLTPAQFNAATDPAENILSIACAGSGKSRTLGYRIAYLVASGANPSGILAFTFTEKAADAIKRRVADALQSAGMDPTIISSMYIGTIHAYCNSLLRTMHPKYQQFDVLDTNRLRLYLQSRWSALNLKDLRARNGIRYFETIDQVTDAWNVANDEIVNLSDIQIIDPLLGAVLTNLKARLDLDQYIDFSSMIRQVVEALESGDAPAREAVRAVEHLMVDEYQDVNFAQESLIRNLREVAKSLFVVGDDDQAIYAWRGADVQNILTFTQRYSNCSVHTLARNFRSAPPIVDCAESFAAAELGALRLEKSPSAVFDPEPRELRTLWFNDRSNEADWIGSAISSLIGTEYREADGSRRGLSYGDVAILMRSTRTMEPDKSTPRHMPYTSVLLANDIPFTLEAGGGLFERS